MEQFRTKMRQQAADFIRGQCIGLLVALVITWLIFGLLSALSLLLGGSICILANWACMLRMFKASGAVPAGAALYEFFAGQVIKFAITLILFIVCIKFIHIGFVPFVIGYSVAQLSLWLTPLVVGKLKKKQMKVLCEVAP